MVGLQIFVEFTDAEGKTYESDPTEPVYVYSFDIKEAKASKVNEIKVTFANPVESENVTFAVKKGTEDFPIEKVEATDWSLTEDEVTLKTSANMAKGTYTVTATDSVTKDTDSADFEVTKQEVAKIVIKNTDAYTNADDRADKAHTEAYAYYDVLDQYDQSIRSSASIQWAGSCDITADKANGMLTLKKNDGKAWVYGEKIYITGVYTKTGAATSETLTVNTEQSLDTIDVVGFLKKGTSDIIEDLPEDFKTEAYYMLFHALDQNGCPLKADQIDREDVTFITDSPLVVKEVTFGEAGAANATDNKPFTVKGTEYNAVYVNPGINVAKGGQVNVTAIANKTGNKTDYSFWVGPDAVITSFDISSPSGVVADGDQGVTVPFEAKTEDGTVITNFKQLAKQEIFNTLSFTTSEGMLKLAEQDDRTAKLTWSDDAKYAVDSAWELSTSTDDIDRPVSLTAIVVGGEPDNEMLSVQDKRRPNSIADVNLADVYVEGDKLPITLGSFQYYDQYGKLIDEDGDATDYGDDNGFFAKAKAKLLKNTDFSAYTFGVRIEYAGTGKIAYTTGGGAVAESVDANGVIDGKKVVIESGETANYSTTTNIKSVATGEGFKFDIAKFKEVTGKAITKPGDWDSVSPSKYKPITVVDITQVKNLTIDDLNKFYVGGIKATITNPAGEAVITGDKIISSNALEDLKDTPLTVTAVGTDGIYDADGDYRQTVKVTGTFGSSKVTIPTDYYTIEANKLQDTDGDDKFDAIIPYVAVVAPNGLQAADLYDKTTAKGVSKDGNDEVTAIVHKLYTDDESDGAYFWASDANGKFVKNEIPDGARSSTIATLRSESNATLTSTANITKAQTAASNAAKLAAVNEVLEGEGYTALTDNDGVYTDLTAFIDGNAPYNNRTGDKGDTTSKSNAATKLTAATTALATAEATEEDAAAALGTANTTTAKGFVTALNTALTNEAAGNLTAADVTNAAAVVDGADGSNTATEIMGAVNNNHMQITDELRDAAIAYVTQKVAQLGTKATFEGTAMYSEADKKAKADQLLTDAQLKSMTEGEIETAAATALAANTAEETTTGDLAKYLKAKKNNLIAIDTLNTKKDDLNALKTGASDTADGTPFTVNAGTTEAQIKALPYRANGLAPKEAAAATYLKAVRDRFKAQKTVTDAEKAYKAWVEEEAVTAAGNAWTASDDQKVANAFAKLVAENNANPNGIPVAPVYDTAKKAITLSDQAPYAADIKGLKDSYTFKSAGTEIYAFYDATQKLGVYLKANGGSLTVVDQYGVVMPNAVLEYTVSNAVEDKDGYAENNFKVSDNGTNDPSIVGAEIGDTFDLVISVAGSTLEKTTKVTVGADTWAAIENNDNRYTEKDGLKDVLEEQRKAGLQ